MLDSEFFEKTVVVPADVWDWCVGTMKAGKPVKGVQESKLIATVKFPDEKEVYVTCWFPRIVQNGEMFSGEYTAELFDEWGDEIECYGGYTDIEDVAEMRFTIQNRDFGGITTYYATLERGEG